MKGVGDKVWDRLIKYSTQDRMVWMGECGIVDGRDDKPYKIEWLSEELKALKPKTIWEIGTNYGSWGWLLYNTLEEFLLLTCDIVERSREEIRFINEHYGKESVEFFHQSSEEFLKGRFGADLVWMDGNHQEDWVRKEILWIESTQAPIVWIDDWSWPEVRKGVEESGTKYKLERTSPMGDVAIMRLEGVSQ